MGDQKNYIMVGLFLALDADTEVEAEDKRTLERVVGSRIRDSEGTLDLTLVKRLAYMVAECTVVKASKKGFLTLLLRSEEGLEVFKIVEKRFEVVGKRQWDPSGGRPVARTLKKALAKSRVQKK